MLLWSLEDGCSICIDAIPVTMLFSSTLTIAVLSHAFRVLNCVLSWVSLLN